MEKENVETDPVVFSLFYVYASLKNFELKSAI